MELSEEVLEAAYHYGIHFQLIKNVTAEGVTTYAVDATCMSNPVPPAVSAMVHGRGQGPSWQDAMGDWQENAEARKNKWRR